MHPRCNQQHTSCLTCNSHRQPLCMSPSPAMQAVILIGHSTGCQDAVRYAQRVQGDLKGSDAAPLAGIVLQAAVRNQETFCGICATSFCLNGMSVALLIQVQFHFTTSMSAQAMAFACASHAHAGRHAVITCHEFVACQHSFMSCIRIPACTAGCASQIWLFLK